MCSPGSGGFWWVGSAIGRDEEKRGEAIGEEGKGGEGVEKRPGVVTPPHTEGGDIGGNIEVHVTAVLSMSSSSPVSTTDFFFLLHPPFLPLFVPTEEEEEDSRREEKIALEELAVC